MNKPGKLTAKRLNHWRVFWKDNPETQYDVFFFRVKNAPPFEYVVIVNKVGGDVHGQKKYWMHESFTPSAKTSIFFVEKYLTERAST